MTKQNHTVYLSLGSNLGDRNQNLLVTIAKIAETTGIVSAISSFYETEPWGFQSENWFLNCVISIETPLLPFELLTITQGIERELGRIEKNSLIYQDRVIDIDILLYDDWIFKSNELELPHPLFHLRRFVLEPLNEIQPNLVHPTINKRISELFSLLTT